MSREKRHFHNDSTFASFSEEITIPREKFVVPFFKIEFVPAAGIARRFAASPWREEVSRFGGKIVVQDAERFRRDFDVRASEETRVVQAVGFQCGEIAVIVKIPIQYGAVMLAAGNERNGFSAEQKIMRFRGLWRGSLRRCLNRWN